MHHRLRVLEEQAAVAKTPALRAQYRINIEQIKSMMVKEPTPRDDRSYEREMAAQILTLDRASGQSADPAPVPQPNVPS